MNGGAFVVTLDFWDRFQDVKTSNLRWFQNSLERLQPQTDNAEWFYRPESKNFYDQFFCPTNLTPISGSIFSHNRASFESVWSAGKSCREHTATQNRSKYRILQPANRATDPIFRFLIQVFVLEIIDSKVVWKSVDKCGRCGIPHFHSVELWISVDETADKIDCQLNDQYSVLAREGTVFYK